MKTIKIAEQMTTTIKQNNMNVFFLFTRFDCSFFNSLTGTEKQTNKQMFYILHLEEHS